jgi:isopentenyl phosphate kinase
VQAAQYSRRAKATKASELKAKPIILKLGGSVITHKDVPFKANELAIERLAGEIAEAKVPQLVVVHGGGSFGHPLAKKYAIKEGFNGKFSQLLGFSKTHQAMITLNNMILKALINHNIPALTIAPSSTIVSKSGRMVAKIDQRLKRLLHIGLVPLLYGDAVLDSDKGFTILSGDQLVAAAAIQLDAERIIIGVEGDGLYMSDPKLGRGDLIRACTLQQLKELGKQARKTTAHDVTGGMQGKIAELVPAVEKGITVVVVNACKPQRVYKALRGEEVIGTIIQKE